jgi:hypothetical protein
MWQCTGLHQDAANRLGDGVSTVVPGRPSSIQHGRKLPPLWTTCAAHAKCQPQRQQLTKCAVVSMHVGKGRNCVRSQRSYKVLRSQHETKWPSSAPVPALTVRRALQHMAPSTTPVCRGNINPHTCFLLMAVACCLAAGPAQPPLTSCSSACALSLRQLQQPVTCGDNRSHPGGAKLCGPLQWPPCQHLITGWL